MTPASNPCLTLVRRASKSPLLGVLMLLYPVAAHAAPPSRTVSGPRVELGEVLPDAPPEMHAIDICQTPPAGTSRLIERQVIERQVRAAGFDPAVLQIPTAVRLAREGRKHSAAELSALLEEPVRRALPPGVTLQQVQVSTALSLEEGATPEPIVLPKLPRRSGAIRVAFSASFDSGTDIPHRLPVTAILQVAPGAATAAVKQGGRVQLTIQRGSAKISADATALAEGDVGDRLQFRVNSTGKVLRGVLLSPTLAKVTE